MIGTRSRQIATACAAVAMAVLVAGCGGGDDDGGGGAAATPTTQPTQVSATATVRPTNTALVVATASPTPVQVARISGLLAVRNDVGARSGDALTPLPPEAGGAVGQDFDRALAHADWMVPGTEAEGVTGGDGRFAITALPPGQHILHVTKTVEGNLMAVDVPFVVGDDGGAVIVAEVGWGLVKATSTYIEDGVEVRVTFAPNGAHMVERDGRVVEFGDYARTLTDADGDGRFDSSNCTSQPQLSACDNADRSCADGTMCSCLPSCPFCEDCGALVCAAPSPNGLYRCSAEGTCQQPGDRCVCVPSCPECDDCRFNACVPGLCEPVEVASIVVEGNTQLVVGQQGSARATAHLSDGSMVDVTWLADWTSSDAAVATVDAWGTIEAVAIGSTDITAAFDDVTSVPLALTVVERPTLLRIYLQNTSCYYYLDVPKPDDPSFPGPLPPIRSDILPVPNCGQVVRIGATIIFRALGEFANGYYEDLTDEVVWSVEPAGVGDVVAGLFTARGVGTAQISAALGPVESEKSEIRVVAEASVVSLSIYGGNWAYPVFDGGPVRPGADAPCFECGYGLTLLRGDTVHFQATAHYDTGEWADVTSEVTWRSSDSAVATIDPSGVATGVGAGTADIDASLGDVRSSPTTLRVVNEATLLNLYIYQEGTNRVLGKGDQAVFKAVGNYDVGFQRDVTAEVTWRSSDETVAAFAGDGVLTGNGAGNVQVWAALGERESDRLSLEVFATSELAYCDAANVNRGTWSDDFNRVVLESDCAAYDRPGLVTLRYTVTETQPHGGIFDPCLDLYIYQGETRIRTLREEGCGDPFLPAGAPGRDEETVLKYQLRAFWDLKNERGEAVPAGTYTVFGRFYLYYDPIVSIDLTVR